MYLKKIDTKKRYSVFPIKNQSLWEYYKMMESQIWTAEEVDLSKDDFNALKENEKTYLKNILAFFTIADGLVIDNLAINFLNEVDILEAQYFYGLQIYGEQVHGNGYSLLIDTYINDAQEKEELFNSMETNPAVTKKAQWAERWIDKGSFAERLLAFALVEGLSFSSVFAGVFWFRSRNLMDGLGEMNDFIVKDETCFSEDTEILTDLGWKYFKDLNKQERVAQFDEGVISYVNPLHYTKKKYVGDMHLIGNNRHQCLVTPDHDMLLYNESKGYYKEKAGEVKFNHTKSIPSFGSVADDCESNLTSTHKVKLALQADGSNLYWKNSSGEKLTRGNGGGYTHSCSLQKSRKIDNLKGLLESSEYKYTSHNIVRGDKDIVTFKVKLHNNFDCKDLSWVYTLDLNLNTCVDIVNEAVRWDGHIVNKNRLIYCSTDKKSIDIIQDIAIRAGYITNIYKSVDNRKGSYKDYYRLSIIKASNYVGSQSFTNKIESYDGMVYCVTVPSGNIITRRNNKTMIAGNCHYEFALNLYKNYLKNEYKLPKEKVLEMVLSCFEVEKEFVNESMPNGLSGLTKGMMEQYVKYVSDIILNDFGCETYFKVNNPLDYMSRIGLSNKNNFFERRTGEYTRVAIPTSEEGLFDDEDF